METLRVNADYETELFTGGPGPKGVNETIEFLVFFLLNNPIYSQKKYDSVYLDYVESVTSQRPIVLQSGPYINWWGRLENLESERKLNSKLTSSSLAIQEGWDQDSFILQKGNALPELKKDTRYLLKEPHHMSGRGFTLIENYSAVNVPNQSLILSPLLNRKYDFSYYILNDEKEIIYENIVDAKFQYKGSKIIHRGRDLSNLTFYREVTKDKWQIFLSAKEVIKLNYIGCPAPGFSIDSFVFENDNELKIFNLSEVNARRTMGLVTYELGQRYAPQKNWWSLILGKSLKNAGGFQYMLEKLSFLISEGSVLILSPGDSRFEILFLMASDAKAGEDLLNQVRLLLPEADFPNF